MEGGGAAGLWAAWAGGTPTISPSCSDEGVGAGAAGRGWAGVAGLTGCDGLGAPATIWRTAELIAAVCGCAALAAVPAGAGGWGLPAPEGVFPFDVMRSFASRFRGDSMP
ncbi:MAG: hypothetical protein HQL43_02225 [Alphaproteobacteria bacterium]|nr:hypothetical protein [Alphaproteobacteria bacterium]